MKYLLAIYVDNSLLHHETARRSLKRIGELQHEPTRIVVVDHAHGVHPTMRDPEHKTRHGDDRPTFAPRAQLHEMADDLLAQCGLNVDEASPALKRWRRAGKLKCWALLEAINHGLDAVMLMRFGDLITADAPAAMAANLGAYPEAQFCYVPTCTADWYGNGQPGAVRCRGRITRMDQYTPTWGCMTRTAGIDPDDLEPALAPMERPAEERTETVSDTQTWRLAVLGRGIGRGVAHYREPLWYTFLNPPPIDKPSWTSGERYVKQCKQLIATAKRAETHTLA